MGRNPAGKPNASPWDDPRLRVPDAAAWASMSVAAREANVEDILATLDEYREAMSEGTRHSRSKIGSFQNLDDHFRRAGRSVFLATELAVLYPGEPVIVPDLLVLVGVDPNLERESWIVMDEGRGVDAVFEFRDLDKKHKDLIENVRDYARLRIPEYFSFDCRRRLLRGFRLPAADARVYQPILPQGGYLPSAVLELGVVEGRLRFFKDLAQIPNSVELVDRLQRMADDHEQRLEESERQRQESERQRQESERQREDERRGREEAVNRFAAAQGAVIAALRARLESRGIQLTDAETARLQSAADDIPQLLRWLERAASATRAADVFSD